MRILLLPVGSHGDVHPFVGLGLRLKKAGYDVVVATSGAFRELVERVGLSFAELGTAEEFDDLASNTDLWHPLKAASFIARNAMLPGMRRQFELIRSLADGQETMLVGSALGLGSSLAHEALGLPFVVLHLQPAVIWSAYRSPKLARYALYSERVPRWLKNLQFRIGIRLMFDRHLLKPANAYRRELGLRSVDSVWEMMHSPQRIIGMFPSWFAPPQPDWPSQLRLTHFPLWDESGTTEVPIEARRFLDVGDPPVVFTPGSAMIHGRKFFEAAIHACQLLGQRGMLLTRHREQIPTSLPEGIRHFDFVPLSQILGQCSALVYHGGIGTLSQALRAGVPHVVMPMAHDQPDNAERLERLGVGETLWPKQFRGRRLAEGIGRLQDSAEVQANCEQIARRFNDIDGLEQTKQIVQQPLLFDA